MDRQEEEDKIDELVPDEISESEHEYASPTNDNDLAWDGSNISSSEDDSNGIDEEDFEIENDLEGNPDLEDSRDSSDGMVGKARRPPSDDECIDPNTGMKKAPLFVDPIGKKK